MVIVSSFRQPIRANQKSVTPAAADRADLRICKLVFAAERLLQDVAARMGAGLALVDLPVAEEPACRPPLVVATGFSSAADGKSAYRRHGRNTSSRV